MIVFCLSGLWNSDVTISSIVHVYLCKTVTDKTVTMFGHWVGHACCVGVPAMVKMNSTKDTSGSHIKRGQCWGIDVLLRAYHRLCDFKLFSLLRHFFCTHGVHLIMSIIVLIIGNQLVPFLLCWYNASSVIHSGWDAGSNNGNLV